jgi:RNA polymerase sigma factor (sigma-70 family)
MAEIVNSENFRRFLKHRPGEALKFLYENYYQTLVGVAHQLTQDSLAAQDVVQDTFVHVWENRAKLADYDGSPIHFYLIRVVKNKAITYFKATRQFEERMIRHYNSQIHPNEAPFETTAIQKEIYQQLRELIDGFPPREKACLLMKIDRDMSPDEIAAESHVTRKAVVKSLTSANKRLRRYWNEKKYGH